jgi:uncharacterized protein (DUF1330 family)
MTAYLIARAHIADAVGYRSYTKDVPEIVERYGGRFLARGGAALSLEGPEAADRIVIIEFPDLVVAESFYRSAEYQQLKQRRLPFATVEFVAIDGVPSP